MDGFPRTAACACGALRVTVTVQPTRVHACCCLECQRRSGSAFTCTAFFPDQAVSVEGSARTWRRGSHAGRYHESNFCLVCGCTMFYRLEALPGITAVPAGAFADPAFPPPQTLYWTMHRPAWLAAPEGAAIFERQ